MKTRKLMLLGKSLLLSTIMTLAPNLLANDQALEAMFQRPLIIGASVSADWRAKSPGKLLALRYTKESNIKTIAHSGRSGSFVLQKWNPATLEDRTSVIGLDLFFWDAMLKSPDESLKAMKKLVADTKERDIPLVLGEIPLLLPHMQPQAAHLNEAMHRICESYAKCTVLPFTSLVTKVIASGGLNYQGKTYGLKELVPDGLHMGPVASQYIADTLYDVLKRSN